MKKFEIFSKKLGKAITIEKASPLDAFLPTGPEEVCDGPMFFWSNGGWSKGFGHWINGGWSKGHGHWINGGWSKGYGHWTKVGWSKGGASHWINGGWSKGDK